MKEFSLRREHRKALRDLKTQKDLVITRPDKGRATVILTKDAYISKMIEILNESSKFKRLGPCESHDNTSKIETSLQSYLKQLYEQKEISESDYVYMRPAGCCRPRRYGLPKVHKQSVPFRPILSMSGSLRFAISKWLCDLLKPVVDFYGAYCVKDSFTFSDKVRTEKLSPNGHVFVRRRRSIHKRPSSRGD